MRKNVDNLKLDVHTILKLQVGVQRREERKLGREGKEMADIVKGKKIKKVNTKDIFRGENTVKEFWFSFFDD